MDPARPSNHKRSVRDFLSNNFNKVLRQSPCPSASRKSLRASSVWSPSSPFPGAQTSLPSHSQSASACTNEDAVETQASAPVSQPLPSASAPVSSEHKTSALVVSPVVADSSPGEGAESPNTSVDFLPDTCHRVTSGLWTGLKIALSALHKSAGLLLPLQSAIGTFIECLDVLEEAAKTHRKYKELTSDLTTLVELLAQHMKHSNSARMSDSIANVARAIQEQAKLIKNKRDNGTGRSKEANVDEEDLENHYRRIAALFRQLQADANLSIWSIVNDQMADTRLNYLAPVQLAKYDSKLSTSISRRSCTANTRTVVLSGLNNWSHDPNSADLYWMNGMAGTGKTTIACSFAEALEERKQLAASFFCTRTVPECREVTRIIPTIAYQLARYSIPFQSALCEALGQDPDVSSRNMTKQFERLLKAPLLKVKEAIPSGLVVVIDALDECDDMREVELLLSILLKSVAELPVRFFATSRPEPEIYRRMLARVQGAGNVLHLHDVGKSLVQADIETYLAEELKFIPPTPAQIRELAQRSGNLFIYAATIVRYIRPGRQSVNARSRLESALAMTSQPDKIHAEIDVLYRAVLEAALNAESLEDKEVEDLRRVLWTAVCVQEPVGVSTLAAITGINDEERAVTALEALRSVIHFSETTRLVSTLHASFPDFMFDERRSEPLTCSLIYHSQLLTRGCFEVMKAQLRFNICELKSSFIRDSKVSNLEELVEQAVSPPLWYACRYWGDHLQSASYSDLLCAMLSDLLSVRLLFWMEVLNLRRGIGKGAVILLKAKLWLKAGAAPADVSWLVEDARNFVTSFASNPVSQSTPHIYTSSLAFCPTSSSVFKQYSKNIRGLLRVTGSAINRREVAPLANWRSESKVYSVAYSPDGGSVAVGCGDSTVSLWSAHDGTILAGPLQGHTGWIYSFAYSPDGLHIASGSSDSTIRVWSTRDGELVAGPFQGHTRGVMSVAYSPDGSHIVSGSGDKTIRLWCIHDSALLADPLQGHTGVVQAVAYSPDGACIVSGSHDKTIRVWSAHDGTLLIGPFIGHTGSVFSVVFSADGTRIVSGSEDTTIRVWSAHDGTVLAGPFKGHVYPVYSVAYSPDNSRIVSGSQDCTILVWSAHDGRLLAGPFKGHTNSVQSVAFSPDGSRIASGSPDQTIKVWSAHDGELPARSFQKHISEVHSIAYSPDGSHIVSGSAPHNTARLWSARNGTLLTDPSKGHTGSILSVAYSPDGSRVASGARNRTIRVWSAHDGTSLTGSFQGHTDSIRSIMYSPDGLRIASGSSDSTIRVWNANDGELLAGPFRGHADRVKSVAYSPDGSRIVSGSSDKTIRVWNAHNGELLAEPFKGHTNEVNSVAFSPNGSRIASGSNDQTIRVWSAHDGTLIIGPLQGHTGSVLSVAYSPDGTQIVSGSRDWTIRVWSAHNGAHIFGPFYGHTGSVWSVAYSPDGTSLASASGDETIRIWSAHTSPLVADPSRIYADLIRHPNATQAPDMSSPHTPNLALDHLAIRPDGWVINTGSQLLFWVPSELAAYFPTSHELLVMYPPDLFQMDHENVFLGDQWHQCYIPE